MAGLDRNTVYKSVYPNSQINGFIILSYQYVKWKSRICNLYDMLVWRVNNIKLCLVLFAHAQTKGGHKNILTGIF